MFKFATLKKTALVFAAGSVGIALNLGFTKPLRAADFSFSLSSGPSATVPGTVTGKILGLPDNGTGPAKQIIIDSYPSYYDSFFKDNYSSCGGIGISGCVDILNPGFLTQVVTNSFTVEKDVIIGASFSGIKFPVVNFPGAFLLYLNRNNENRMGLIYENGNSGTGNLDGLAGLNLQPIKPNPTSVPEPGASTLAMLALGGFLLKKKLAS